MHHMSATPSISNSHLSALSVQPYLIRLQYLLICLREDRLCVPWLYSSESVVVSPDSRDVLAGTFSQDCIHRSAMQRLESHTGHFLRPPDFWRRKTDALVRTGAVVRMFAGDGPGRFVSYRSGSSADPHKPGKNHAWPSPADSETGLPQCTRKRCQVGPLHQGRLLTAVRCAQG